MLEEAVPTFSSTLDAARFYHGLGWCVVPARMKSKFPAIRWKMYQTQRPKETELEEWFKDDRHRIGLLTGELSDVVIVDLDSEEAVETAKRRGVWSPLRVRTSRGLQLFFRRGDQEVKNAVGIDVKTDIRGDRGFAILPPSIHESGKAYVWESWGDTAPEFKPEWFPERQGARYNPPGWIADSLNNLAELPRRPTLIKIAGRLLHQGWMVEDVATILQPHALEAGLSDDDFFTCMESIKGYEQLDTELSSVSASDLVSTAKDLDFLVAGIIPRQTTTIFGGVPKMGKSYLTLDMAIEMSRGGKWLGVHPCTPGRVLYFDEENAAPLMSLRLRNLLAGKQYAPPPNRLQFVVGQRINLSSPASVEKIKQKLDSFKPDMVVIDSLIRVSSAEENSSREMSQVFGVIRGLVDEFKCAFCIIDHEGKRGYTRPEDDVVRAPAPGDLRGTNEKGAFADAVFSYKKQQGMRILYQTDSRWTDPMDPVMVTLEHVAAGVSILKGDKICLDA